MFKRAKAEAEAEADQDGGEPAPEERVRAALLRMEINLQAEEGQIERNRKAEEAMLLRVLDDKSQEEVTR